MRKHTIKLHICVNQRIRFCNSHEDSQCRMPKHIMKLHIRVSCALPNVAKCHAGHADRFCRPAKFKQPSKHSRFRNSAARVPVGLGLEQGKATAGLAGGSQSRGRLGRRPELGLEPRLRWPCRCPVAPTASMVPRTLPWQTTSIEHQLISFVRI